ncbi:MAG: ABC transporter permease subunit [Methylobacter sp.]|uniref:ABC transporter permease subunit n=1 Tax=Methylobacter sp. TaxID=2051955 RepID=UPI0025862D85|nr:ABC transporter permease subunit [Methylobacter sp.]MCL7419603.1 ABC transporter permease subunit [Methylobacter sp.]
MNKPMLLTLIILAVIAFIAGCEKTETVIARLDDAETARIGVMTGSTGEAITTARFPKAQVKSFDDIMDAVAAMSSGQLDAIVTAYPAALQVSKKNPELGLLPEPLSYEDTAIAVKKGNDELLTTLNRIISELKSDGTLESMKQRWFKPDLTPYEELNITLPKEGKPLKIGVSATREPFSFVDKNGRVTGHDGELARIIGAKLNRPVEFYNMKFMALIPALQSGKVDLIVTGMTATDERKKFVDFTQPYYANAQVMLVRKSATVKPAPSESSAKDGDEISKLEHIDGKRIGVLGGSAGDLAARKHFPNATFQVFTAAADAALAVKTRKTDAFVYDKSVLLNLAEKNPELVILDEPVDKLEVAAAIRKDNTALLAEINRVLSELKQEGTLQRLRAKWIDSKYTVTPQISPISETDIKDVLRMGTCAAIEPFSFHANGTLTGLDIELSQLIGKRLGKKIEITDMHFEALIPALQSGKIDFALSNFNVTEERKKLVLFSLPYVENDISALVRRLPSSGTAVKQDSKLASIEDLKDKRIGVMVGSAHDTYATKNYPDATILQYKSPADVALALKSGKVDAALFDAEPLREIMRQDDTLGLLGDSLFTFDVGVGFKKDNEALRDQFNQFLAQIKQNGIHRDMIRRWMEKGDTRMPVIENAKSNGVMVAGVSDVGLPFTAVKDNRLVGFDIELAERFAAYLGKEVKFANMDFGSLIAAVSAGKVDMIVSSIYVTEERKKQINFSDPYYEMGTRVFALKKNITTGKQSASDQTRAKKLASIDDLKDKRIGVLLGSIHDTYAAQHYPDAAIYTRETLLAILRNDSELGVLGDSLLSNPIGMGFNKDNDLLREQFNAFLKQIKSNGVFDDMVNRWIKNGSTVMPAIPNSGANGVLTVGIVSDKGLPFAVIQDNRLIGFDIELAERFGAYLGKRIQYADMEFGNLIAAVSTGKIDMIDSTLMFTEERKTRIDFSDPYYELGASVFALRKNLTVYDSDSNAVTELPTFFTRIADSFYSNIIQENRYLLIWDGLKTTMVISIFATLFGTLLGALVCFMRMSKRTVLNLPARVYINIIRGMPVLVLLMLIFYVIFASVNISPVLVAIIAFGMNFAAYVSEIFRSGIEGVGKGQIEAGIAMGFTRVKTFVFIVLPQTVQRILPVYKGEFISLVKMTSIVGYIAVQDLTKASDIIRSRTFDAFFPLVMVAILYFVIAWILMLSLEYLERITDPKYKRRKAARP